MAEPQCDDRAIDAGLSNSIEAVCRNSWGEMRFSLNEAHRARAALTYLPRRYWTASALMRPPCKLGNSAMALLSGGLANDN
jgi:hypothetical protein